MHGETIKITKVHARAGDQTPDCPTRRLVTALITLQWICDHMMSPQSTGG